MAINNIEALTSFIGRIEEKQADRKIINGELRGIYDEIRAAGMDAATVRQMVRERGLEDDVRAEQYRLRDEYRRALGLLADTPLGQAMQPPADPPRVEWPTEFAQQPVHQPRRRRQRHFDAEHPQGTA